jgi:hypothetical protein
VHLSKHAETLGTRTNKKRLGALFESFLGALFLDYNKVDARDVDLDLGPDLVLGPGYQMCQKFVESIFEQHVDWVDLVKSDRNFKSQLQEKCQQNFRVTPHYLGTSGPITSLDGVYKMGVYLCIGQPIHAVNTQDAIPVQTFASINAMHDHIAANGGKLFCLLGEGTDRSKKMAEQHSCETAIRIFPASSEKNDDQV